MRSASECRLVAARSGRTLDLPTLAKYYEWTLGAANALVKRYEDAIRAAEKDLKVFNDNKALFKKIWSADAISATPPADASGQLQTMQIQRIAEVMKEQTAATQAAAKALRQRAAETREHNAGIAKFQNWLNLVKAGIETGKAANEGSSNPGDENSKPNSVLIEITSNNPWRLRPSRRRFPPPRTAPPPSSSKAPTSRPGPTQERFL